MSEGWTKEALADALKREIVAKWRGGAAGGGGIDCLELAEALLASMPRSSTAAPAQEGMREALQAFVDKIDHVILVEDDHPHSDLAEELRGAIRALSAPAEPAGRELLEGARDLLEELEEYFDARADAEYFTDSPSPHPNEEMSLLCEVRATLSKLRTALGEGK